MSSGPPPYAPRDHAQVPPAPPGGAGPSALQSESLEFAESTAVNLEWKLTGLKEVHNATKGDVKSKCVKSAIFGDADNLWEVLWYPNSGVAGADTASLYLSCVPTPQERDSAINSKWTRKGLWWFRFEIRVPVPVGEVGSRPKVIATKDASDHTFAVKTANWGWQQFAKRDQLFQDPHVLQADSFIISCTIQAQPQPPAGYWLGMGLPPSVPFVSANAVVGSKTVGSGGGLSAWAGGEGASGGVAGGTTAGGGVKKVVPRDLISSVGALLDDPLYSDIEFVIPARTTRRSNPNGDQEKRSSRKIYATKKLLTRCEYFHAMFNGGFREVEGTIEDEVEDDDYDVLSDSDVEEEATVPSGPPQSIQIPRPASRASTLAPRRSSTSADASASASASLERDDEDEESVAESNDEATSTPGEINAEEQKELAVEEVPAKKDTVPVTPGRHPRNVTGPKKTRVIVRDAAWSTWWAVLYWLYTDTIYFAPLSSSFDPTSTSNRSRPSSITAPPHTNEIRSRRDWIRVWMHEHGVSENENLTDLTDDEDSPVGPRPVSAKAVYRLADKLDLPPLKLRAFQHIAGQLTAQNIPAEVFSRFSSTFEDVRKVQVAFFLKHWTEIKKSDNMTQIWQQIRLGRHVGFEEVWPLIVGQLDFKPS